MQRIIITEQDNTSNVEGLSSYDIVYVPGFATNNLLPSYDDTEDGKGASTFRNPTLVRSRFEFQQKFGTTCPRFSKTQYYPIATDSTIGFPSYAIPGYSSITSKENYEEIHLNNIECSIAEVQTTPTTPTTPVEDQTETPGEQTETPTSQTTSNDSPSQWQLIAEAVVETEYYQLPVGVTGEESMDTWVPDDSETTYYKAEGSVEEGSDKMILKMVQLQYEDISKVKPGDFARQNIFISNTSPLDNDWYILYNNRYHLTSDQSIGFDTNGVVRQYYQLKDGSAPPIMFNGASGTYEGDPDPGYRYALYLLSLGIPVYYEQMNADFELVDTSLPENEKANPMKNGWYERPDGSADFIRSTDLKIETGKEYYYGADISIRSMYEGLDARFSGFDKTPQADGDEGYDDSAGYAIDSMGDYAVKYFTSGGYPTFEYGTLGEDENGGMYVLSSGLSESMISAARARGDAVALIDHTNAPNRPIHTTSDISVITRAREGFSNLDLVQGSYGAMFTPWYTCTHPAVTGGASSDYPSTAYQMPASLAFLSALARQLQNQNPWLAVAGVSRGQVPYFGGLHTNYKLTNNVADSYQIIPGQTVTDTNITAISINPITNIRNYGYCIWGNRTLRNNTSGTKATSFLNIRDVVSDIKKRLYEASQSLLFEQNTDVLWLNFKNLITPLLDTMRSNYILDDYNIVKYNIDPETGEQVPAYKILAAIRIVPISSVEVFELQLSLENREFSVSEVE